MALTTAQMAALNALLQQYPSSSSHPNLLAEMFVLMPAGVRTEWKTETIALITSAKSSEAAVFDSQTSLVNST